MVRPAVMWWALALATPTLEERIERLWVAYPPLNTEASVTQGGVLFQGNQEKGLEREIAALRTRANRPLLVFFDLEGGQVNGLRTYPGCRVPSARSVGDGHADATAMGASIAGCLQSVGITANLGPVLDIDTTGHLHSHRRSFGAEPTAPAAVVTAELQRAGIVVFAKHFPGYGSTTDDTDHRISASARTPTLGDPELLPFQAVPSDGVMMSHRTYAGSNEPAVFDPALVAMAHELGRVTITDDLLVGAAVRHAGSPEKAIAAAFLAGNDLLLTSAPRDWERMPDLVGVIRRLIEADPRLEAQLNQSYERVISLETKLNSTNP